MRRIRVRRLAKWLIPLLVLCLAAGCGKEGQDAETEIETESEKSTGDYVEKEILKEEGIEDNQEIYAEDDETSVVTMYLTICEGNEEDNTNHTWSEINQYSAYYYEENELDRYNVDAILEIGDESGPLEGEFGYGETIPNAAVQIRGQSSSRNVQKNYKIRIKEEKGEWRGQRTLALNKHVSDPYRIVNKLAYDLMKDIPEMMSARTQFVHLYVKDQAGGETTFADYGLYTQVEQINKTYLKNHNLDNQGHLYKLNFFEWRAYDEVMKLTTDPDYREAEFESYLESKGNEDHSKLQEVLEKVNNYAIPIEEIIEENFDVENICYWMAFHILIGNTDVSSRNAYLYSPLNSKKWYYISWDNDGAFVRNYYRSRNYISGESWERGLTQFVNGILFNRMFQVEKYRTALEEAVEDLKNNYLTEDAVREKIVSYAGIAKPYIYREPDEEYARVSEEDYDELIEVLASEIEENYQYYKESLEKPWPFYVGVPERKEDGLWITWDASYDIDDEDITYHVMLASDYEFNEILLEQDEIRVPQLKIDELPPGLYFIRVRSKNTSGYEQDCFDYCSVSGIGKVYGVKSFVVEENGSILEYTDEIERIGEETETEEPGEPETPEETEGADEK